MDAVNVVLVNPSQHSELIRTVREYKRDDMILHEMKMHTVSISASFAAAIANCAIALLLIRRKTEQQMGRRRRIKPLKLVRGQAVIVLILLGCENRFLEEMWR